MFSQAIEAYFEQFLGVANNLIACTAEISYGTGYRGRPWVNNG